MHVFRNSWIYSEISSTYSGIYARENMTSEAGCAFFRTSHWWGCVAYFVWSGFEIWDWGLEFGGLRVGLRVEGWGLRVAVYAFRRTWCSEWWFDNMNVFRNMYIFRNMYVSRNMYIFRNYMYIFRNSCMYSENKCIYSGIYLSRFDQIAHTPRRWKAAKP